MQRRRSSVAAVSDHRWLRMMAFVVIGSQLAALVRAKATVEQMMKTGEMMRNVCLTKTKVDVELVEGLRESRFPDIKELKCYTNCVMEMMQTMKKGKLNYDASIKQIEMIMPDELAGPMRTSLDICRTAADGIKNSCDAAYAMLQCMSKNNPQFVFP